MQTENYYKQFGEKGKTLEIFDNEIVELIGKLKHFGNIRKELLEDFARETSKYKVGQWLNDKVRVDNIIWNNNQIELLVFNKSHRMDSVYELEVEKYLLEN